MMRKIVAMSLVLVGASLTTAVGQVLPKGRDVARGRAVFEDQCASCHGPGIGNPGLKFRPGTDALRIKYAGSDPAIPALLTDREDLTPEVIEYFVRNGATVMPFFRKTDVSDADLRSLSAYLTQKEAGK